VNSIPSEMPVVAQLHLGFIDRNLISQVLNFASCRKHEVLI